jgi:hypothetical protein
MKTPTLKQIRNAQNTIGIDEGALLLRITNKIEHQSPKKINLAKATFGKKHIKLHHLLQWDQQYKKLPI